MKLVLARHAHVIQPSVRLDAAYYTSDGTRALALIHAWAGREQLRLGNKSRTSLVRPLESLCNGRPFIPSRFKRIYATDPAHGLPYITGSTIVEADPLAKTAYLSRKHTLNKDELMLRKGMIVITCSGAIGNVVRIYGSLDGTLGSPDLLRVVADEKQVRPGYLYAYLSSRIGKALIRQQTYGAVISHIEAHHIYNLPVPLLSSSIQRRVHDLVERAASYRNEASTILRSAVARMEQLVLRLPRGYRWQYTSDHSSAIELAQFAGKTTRLDAFHFIGYVQEGLRFLKEPIVLANLARPYQPPVFKRPYTTEESGIPFLSAIDLYDSEPQPHMWISRQMKEIQSYVVEAGTILVQRSGQRYGLFGRPTILPKHLDRTAVIEHLVRIYPHDPRDRGFIYVYLLSEVGRRALLKNSFGTSMGSLFEESFSRTKIPDCRPSIRYSFDEDVALTIDLRAQAHDLETRAQSLILAELDPES